MPTPLSCLRQMSMWTCSTMIWLNGTPQAGGRILFRSSGLLNVEKCYQLEDADAIYEELVRYEHEHNIDPFDVQLCLDQIEWGRMHQPRKTLFVLTAAKVVAQIKRERPQRSLLFVCLTGSTVGFEGCGVISSNRPTQP